MRAVDLEAVIAHLSADDQEDRVRVECQAMLSFNRLRWQGYMGYLSRVDPFACIQGERILPAVEGSGSNHSAFAWPRVLYPRR